MLPAPINITGQEAMGFFASFVFEPNVFERKRQRGGLPFHPGLLLEEEEFLLSGAMFEGQMK